MLHSIEFIDEDLKEIHYIIYRDFCRLNMIDENLRFISKKQGKIILSPYEDIESFEPSFPLQKIELLNMTIIYF